MTRINALINNVVNQLLFLGNQNGGRPWNRTKRASPRGSYSPLPHLAACRPRLLKEERERVLTIGFWPRQQKIVKFMR